MLRLGVGLTPQQVETLISTIDVSNPDSLLFRSRADVSAVWCLPFRRCALSLYAGGR
jgi:hypothetical protein